MAFVFSSLSKPKQTPVKVDIVYIPAIGADPQKTWDRQKGSLDSHRERLDYVLHDSLYPDAETHIYDHLTQEERSLEVKPRYDEEHTRSAEAFAAAEARIADFGVMEWSERFLQTLQSRRQARRTNHRPIIFVCHSTGGIVVKHMLSGEAGSGIAAVCLGVTFFATPHHGSSVLSEPEYVRTVQDHLGLKWEMSENLRHDFFLGNQEMKTLNYNFAYKVMGLKIYSYVEMRDTDLVVLSTNDSSGGETETTIRLCIVDSRSGTLSTTEVPAEDEEVITLNTTHVGTPRFLGLDELCDYYVEEITRFVRNYSAEERAAFHELNDKIMTGIEIDVHQFYEAKTQAGTKSMRVLSAHPRLRTFLELGPTRCMGDRLRGSTNAETPKSNGSIRPTLELSPASEPAAPTLTITTVPADDASFEESMTNPGSALAAPAVAVPKSIHTRRPSMTANMETPGSPGHLMPKSSRTVQFKDIHMNGGAPLKDIDPYRPPQKKQLFPLPSLSSERFKWIHVPFTHAGWVHHILTTVSREKENLDLHSQVLMDKVWFSQHNRSRHASPHARFVRPSVRFLPSINAAAAHIDAITTPLNTTGEIQFVAYIPYLHWDSFRNLQKRAAIINKRQRQGLARPIPKDVTSWSMEHKLMWQHLTSERPLHCRRTLDQYGYPSLRNTSVRDGDQILYKRTRAGADSSQPKAPTLKHKQRSSAGRQSVAGSANIDGSVDVAPVDEAAKVLMVDQLWLWVMDSQTVVTFFPSKEKEGNDDGVSKEADVRSEIYQDINGDYASQCVDPYDFAALAVFHAIKAMLERPTNRDLQVFRIFEEYISILTEQQTASFKHFRNTQGYDQSNDIDAQSHIDNRKDLRKDLDALLELRDIEDELKTIDKLFKEQQVCVTEMVTQYKRLNTRHSKGIKGTGFLNDVSQFINEQQEQIVNMLKGAEAAQRAFKDLLDMKQKQANVDEAHSARRQTEVAADQSRSLMIFTIFTIIFLPLSFFASVFGINSKEWSGGNYLQLHTIFTYMGSISLAVIVVALLVAFNKYTRRIIQKVWIAVGRHLLPPLQRTGIIRQIPLNYIPSADGGSLMDVEKGAAAHQERAESKSLSMISRTHTMNNWEEELRLHRQSFARF